MARWTLRSALARGATPADALRLLNDVMLGNQSDDRFITAVCLRLTVEPRVATVDIACAGHPAPVHVPAAGSALEVPAHGDLLGIFPTINLATSELQLQPGDSLVAYTDGVTDQGPHANPSPEHALEQRGAGAGAEELAGILEQLAQPPVGRQRDDIAILALRFLGGQGDAGSAMATFEPRQKLPEIA